MLTFSLYYIYIMRNTKQLLLKILINHRINSYLNKIMCTSKTIFFLYKGWNKRRWKRNAICCRLDEIYSHFRSFQFLEKYIPCLDTLTTALYLRVSCTQLNFVALFSITFLEWPKRCLKMFLCWSISKTVWSV